MIYIFDDNRFGQMSHNYHVDFLQELPKYEFVTHIKKHSRQIEGYTFLDNATAVFIHDSFPNGDDYTDSEHRKEIVARSIYRKIPYAIFSNGFAITVFDEINNNSIKAIKKDRFYYNLISFLDDYAQNRTFLRERLAIGKDYEKVKTYQIENRLSFFLFDKRNNFFYDDMIKVNNERGKDIIELFYFLYGENSEQAFLKFHNECIEKKILVKDLKIYLHNLVNQILEKLDNYED